MCLAGLSCQLCLEMVTKQMGQAKALESGPRPGEGAVQMWTHGRCFLDARWKPLLPGPGGQAGLSWARDQLSLQRFAPGSFQNADCSPSPRMVVTVLRSSGISFSPEISLPGSSLSCDSHLTSRTWGWEEGLRDRPVV